jgi:hypothetical protein
MKILEAVFVDPNKVRIATSKLHKLTKGNYKISIYYMEFQ